MIASTGETKDNVFLLFLLVGLFSMQYAEVLAGSSQIWYVNPFFILITFPLYLLHVLFYFKLTIYFDKIELRHLYFWGILFGLYEAPMTKVLFSGYINQKPVLGTLGGIAYFEFFTVVLFWHPIFSLILPILTFDVFLIKNNRKSILSIPGSHLSLLTKTKKKHIILFVSSFFLASFQARAEGYNITGTLLAHGGTLFLTITLWWYVNKKNHWEFDDLEVGRKGFIVTTVLIIGLYLLGWFTTPQQPASTPIAYIVLILFVGVIIFLLKISTKREEFVIIDENKVEEHLFGFKHYLYFYGLIILFSSVYCIIPSLGEIIAIFSFTVLPVLGVIVFFYTIVSTIKMR